MKRHKEKIDSESWLARQVFAHFGLAMHWAQSVEYGTTVVMLATGMLEGVISSTDEFEIERSAMISMTMGQARNEFLRRRPDLLDFGDKLRRAVKLRNFLAHRYFHERAAAFMTKEGQESMIGELQDAAEFLENVNAEFEALELDMAQALGATEERLAEIYAGLHHGGFGEALPGL